MKAVISLAGAVALCGCGEDPRSFEEAMAYRPKARLVSQYAVLEKDFTQSLDVALDGTAFKSRVYGRKFEGYCGVVEVAGNQFTAWRTKTELHITHLGENRTQLRRDECLPLSAEDLHWLSKQSPSWTPVATTSHYVDSGFRSPLVDARARRFEQEVAASVSRSIMQEGLPGGADARVRQTLVGPAGESCGIINAKNVRGQYTGEQRFITTAGVTLFEQDVGVLEMDRLWRDVCRG